MWYMMLESGRFDSCILGSVESGIFWDVVGRCPKAYVDVLDVLHVIVCVIVFIIIIIIVL